MDATIEGRARSGTDRAVAANAGRRLDGSACAAWAALVVAGAAALYVASPDLARIGTRFPPLHARWDWRAGPSAIAAVGVAAAAVVAGPRLAARASFRAVLAGSAALAALWSVALALVDGTPGLLAPVVRRSEYLAGVAHVTSPAAFLRGFVDHLAGAPVHVQGHPPGYPLVVWAIDRLGFGAGGVTALQVVGGALAAPAVVVTVRAVSGETFARAGAPFVALAPAAIWMASSADAFFAGVGAWAVACTVLAIARDDRRGDGLALVGGLLFGVLAFQSYGLVLLAAVPVAVAVARRRARPIALAGAGAAFVFAAFLGLGFWWLDGLFATRARYLAGIASRRPFAAFAVSDLSCVAVVTGPAVAVGLRSLRRSAWLLPGAAIAAIALADLSGMAKGEVERIWLPFTIWLLPAAGAIAARGRAGTRASWWLAAQAAFAILLQVAVRTPW
ncbi:MAG TPA: hypothetical protein VFC99_19455 [Acidimicrobiia bacterium]|nr:hypothetical protein [Acidimicrobiia bacterium]